MASKRVGIVGAGSIAMAYAAWIASRGHEAALWSPRSDSASILAHEPLTAIGILETTQAVGCHASAKDLADWAEVIVIAVPLNGHRSVIDALLPSLRAGQTVIVSSMASLSSLYLYERARAHGLDISVASFGTTALTARRKGPTQVNVMMRRRALGVSCLPQAGAPAVLELCTALFGNDFTIDDNPLISTLGNTSAVSHVPLALFNWTRIERAENWPQYHYMTPRVSAVIEALDAERLAVARAFGWELRKVQDKLAQPLGIAPESSLAVVAAALHEKRGGPAGPVDVQTRYLSEDVPYGLAFMLALGRIAGVQMPATEASVQMAGMIVGADLAAGNDLINALELSSETVDGLLARMTLT